ncbi:MAG: hypothetical protein Q4D52_04765 [Eubacteriales bacterium]|nr:hypothetical protein [Eubacteriales bacterium]
MKKNLLYLSALLLTVCVFSGCQILSGKDRDARPSGFVSDQMPSESEIGFSNTARAGLTDMAPSAYSSLQEVREDADMVIRGKVVGIDYVTEESGSIHTREFIEILDVLAGEANIGTVIETRVDGGYALISEYLKHCNKDSAETAKVFFLQGIPEDQYDKKYVSKMVAGEKSPQIGDESVYLMKRKDSAQENLFYSRIEGAISEYFLCHDGQYLVPDYVHSPDLIRRVINGEATKDYEGYTKITYEELLTQMGLGK